MSAARPAARRTHSTAANARLAVPRRRRRRAAVWLTALALLATSAIAREVVRTATPGFDGADGEPGDPGSNGSPGYAAKIRPAVARSADPKNIAVADGRGTSGGQGGSGGPGSPEGENDEDANGGNGADGGGAESAQALAATDWTQGFATDAPVVTEAHATATGPGGGNGGGPGTGAGDGTDGEAGDGAGGGDAGANAGSANLDHGSIATARAEAGPGGGSVHDGNGGQGGSATAAANASTTGEGPATAEALAKGGSGGRTSKGEGAGLGGGAGSGSANAFATAELGDAEATARGDGGAGGSGGGAGSPGSGSATAMAENHGPGKVKANARASGGRGGQGTVSGGTGGGASATARAVSRGGGDVSATANAGGGSGPGGGASVSLDNAAMVNTSGAATLRQIARGGSSRGAAGGSASSQVNFEHPGAGRLNVHLEANAGKGGSAGGAASTRGEISNLGPVTLSATSRGGGGGAGGEAVVGPLFAASRGDEQVIVRARGSGGSGSRPAEVDLHNTVGGSTAGRLRLEQYATGGNGTERGATGAPASSRLERQHRGERLYLLAESKGGAGRESGGGGDARVVLGGGNAAGELILRGEALGGAAGASNMSAPAGDATLQASARAGAESGDIDLRVESTGGPGGAAKTSLSREETAAYAARNEAALAWADRFGVGGDAITNVDVTAEGAGEILVQAETAGGSARAEGVLPASGGDASGRVQVSAAAAERVRIGGNVHAGDARLDGTPGVARVRVEATTRRQLQAHARAVSGAGASFGMADAHVQGAAADGSLSARADARLSEMAGPMNRLAASVQVVPRHGTDAAAAALLLGIQALSGPEAGDEPPDGVNAGLQRHAVVRLVPYPAGQPDALFGLGIEARHPVSEAQARQYRAANDPALARLAEPLEVVAGFHWPSGALPPVVVRGLGGERNGSSPLRIAIAGLHDGGSHGGFVLDDGEAAHAFERIFDGRWTPQDLLAAPGGNPPRTGIEFTVLLPPGGDFEGSLVVSRPL